MPNMSYIHSDRTIVTTTIYYIILRTIPLAIITMIEGSSVKFLTVWERRRFESIATSWAVFLTQTHTSPSESRRITFGTTQAHMSRVRLASHNQGQPAARTVRPSLPLGSCLAPNTSLLPPVCALLQNGA